MAALGVHDSGAHMAGFAPRPAIPPDVNSSLRSQHRRGSGGHQNQSGVATRDGWRHRASGVGQKSTRSGRNRSSSSSWSGSSSSSSTPDRDGGVYSDDGDGAGNDRRVRRSSGGGSKKHGRPGRGDGGRRDPYSASASNTAGKAGGERRRSRSSSPKRRRGDAGDVRGRSRERRGFEPSKDYSDEDEGGGKAYSRRSGGSGRGRNGGSERSERKGASNSSRCAPLKLHHFVTRNAR